jgi:hypothetical protein
VPRPNRRSLAKERAVLPPCMQAQRTDGKGRCVWQLLHPAHCIRLVHCGAPAQQLPQALRVAILGSQVQRCAAVLHAYLTVHAYACSTTAHALTLLAWFTAAPLSSSSFRHSRWPFWEVRCRAVTPPCMHMWQHIVHCTFI